MKFGYEFRRTTIQVIQDNTFRGKLDFPDLSSFLEGVPDSGKQWKATRCGILSKTVTDFMFRTASA